MLTSCVSVCLSSLSWQVLRKFNSVYYTADPINSFFVQNSLLNNIKKTEWILIQIFYFICVINRFNTAHSSPAGILIGLHFSSWNFGLWKQFLLKNILRYDCIIAGVFKFLDKTIDLLFSDYSIDSVKQVIRKCTLCTVTSSDLLLPLN